jgi:hypothetical protein
MECVAFGISGHPPVNDNFQFTSYFFTVLEISLLICLSFGGLFSRSHLNTELLAALLFLLHSCQRQSSSPVDHSLLVFH